MFTLFCISCLTMSVLFLQPLAAQAATLSSQSATPPLVIHTPQFAVNNVAWSPDSRQLAVANADGTVQTWSSGHLLATHVTSFRSVDAHVVGWSRDERSVISYGSFQANEDGPGVRVERWDAATGTTLFTFDTFTANMSLSPDRTRIALASISLDIRDAVTGNLLRSIPTSSALSASEVQWSPDGTRLAVIDYNAQKFVNSVAVWNAVTGQHLATYFAPSGQGIGAFAWSADSQNLFALDSSYPSIVQKFNATTGKVLLTYSLKPNLFTSLSASPDGKSLALQSYGTLQVWSATANKLFFAVGDNNTHVTGNAWSPDGSMIVLIGNNYPMQIRATATGHVSLTYSNANYIGAVVWTPDGGSLTTMSSENVSVWSANVNRLLLTLPAHHQWENSVTWSPDGKQIAAEDGGTYYTAAWNAQTGVNLGDFYFYH